MDKNSWPLMKCFESCRAGLILLLLVIVYVVLAFVCHGLTLPGCLKWGWTQTSFGCAFLYFTVYLLFFLVWVYWVLLFQLPLPSVISDSRLCDFKHSIISMSALFALLIVDLEMVNVLCLFKPLLDHSFLVHVCVFSFYTLNVFP